MPTNYLTHRCQTPQYCPPPKIYDIAFSLNVRQLRQLNRWLKDVSQAAATIQLEKLAKAASGIQWRTVPYYGATGGGITFRFTPTGMGLACFVTEAITGRTLNLTDYEAW